MAKKKVQEDTVTSGLAGGLGIKPDGTGDSFGKNPMMRSGGLNKSSKYLPALEF